MKPYLLAIDNGSQSTKVTIFDARGRALAAASRRLEPYDISVPGHAVHPDDDIWVSIAGACRDVMAAFGGDPADIAALPHQAVTLQLEGKTEACDAVPLSLILAKVGAPQGKALRGPEMADVIEVGAADGYHVALALAEADPFVRNGLRSFELKEWTIMEGSLGLRVNLSDQTVEVI